MKQCLIQLHFYWIVLLLGMMACTAPESSTPRVQPSPPITLSGEGEEPVVADPVLTIVPIQLNFDLHDRGGLAADCYITEVTFDMPHSDGQPTYPMTLAFKHRDTGCVPEEWEMMGTLLRIADQETRVWYATKDRQEAVLLLLKEPQPLQSRALYWNGVSVDELVNKPLDELYELEEAQYPYRISQDERQE